MIDLDASLALMNECQLERCSVKSCMTCSELLDCKTRDDYVMAVYKSMNPDMTGGFEF